MIVKTIGLACVALGGAALGWTLADGLARRERALSQALAQWKLLRANVVHLATPLAEAFDAVAHETSASAGAWLADFASRLRGCCGDGADGSVYEAARASLKQARGLMKGLTLADIEALARMIETVSRSDFSRLARSFDAGEETLAAMRDAAAERCQKNRNLYRTLGVLGGLATAMMLW